MGQFFTSGGQALEFQLQHQSFQRGMAHSLTELREPLQHDKAVRCEGVGSVLQGAEDAAGRSALCSPAVKAVSFPGVRGIPTLPPRKA